MKEQKKDAHTRIETGSELGVSISLAKVAMLRGRFSGCDCLFRTPAGKEGAEMKHIF
jgi:hypothetical protein